MESSIVILLPSALYNKSSRSCKGKLPGVCRLQEILPLATQILHFKPQFPRVEILLQNQSLISCKLFSRLTVLQSGGQGQRGEWWDTRLLNTAGVAELIATASVDEYTRGPTLRHLKYLRLNLISFVPSLLFLM